MVDLGRRPQREVGFESEAEHALQREGDDVEPEQGLGNRWHYDSFGGGLVTGRCGQCPVEVVRGRLEFKTRAG